MHWPTVHFLQEMSKIALEVEGFLRLASTQIHFATCVISSSAAMFLSTGTVHEFAMVGSASRYLDSMASSP